MANRQCSQPLQRAVTDFGADVSFAQAAGKLHEHYGITLPTETIRRIVEGHAREMFEERKLEEEWPTGKGESRLVAEMDGSMVPIVEPNPETEDRRKGKRLEWKEAKLCLVHALGSATPMAGP